MSKYAGSCQSLGFLCDWQVTAESRTDVVSWLVDHLNNVHGTGSTSPALNALIDRHVSDLPAGGSGKPTHVKESRS